MIRRPFDTEWDTSQLSRERRAYLDEALHFEEVTSRILATSEVLGVRNIPYGTPARDEPRNARQAVFLVRADAQACDALYNARDGLRGRYWQSPDCGYEATKHLIGRLIPALLLFSDHHPPVPEGKAAPMSCDDIRASLQGMSAKVWPRERDSDGSSLLLEQPQQLVVPRWIENEKVAQINKGMWRRTPKGGELEIKGAILGVDQTEYVPDGKRDRSCQIFRFGFT